MCVGCPAPVHLLLRMRIMQECRGHVAFPGGTMAGASTFQPAVAATYATDTLTYMIIVGLAEISQPPSQFARKDWQHVQRRATCSVDTVGSRAPTHKTQTHSCGTSLLSRKRDHARKRHDSAVGWAQRRYLAVLQNSAGLPDKRTRSRSIT